MRIITGLAKGTKLVTLEGEATRPTSERVKEAVFSMIQFDIEGRRVLDLFAGSGQLGLEAISRGAAKAVMVDRSKDAVKIINSNVNKTRFADRSEVFCMDYSEYVRRYAGERFDIVFLDPPYAQGLYAPALAALLKADMLKDTTIIVCESDTDNIFAKDEALADKFEVVRVSRYSKTVVTLLSPKKSEDGGEIE